MAASVFTCCRWVPVVAGESFKASAARFFSLTDVTMAGRMNGGITTMKAVAAGGAARLSASGPNHTLNRVSHLARYEWIGSPLGVDALRTDKSNRAREDCGAATRQYARGFSGDAQSLKIWNRLPMWSKRAKEFCRPCREFLRAPASQASVVRGCAWLAAASLQKELATETETCWPRARGRELGPRRRNAATSRCFPRS